jgi:Protein of unknown function, DUF547
MGGSDGVVAVREAVLGSVLGAGRREILNGGRTDGAPALLRDVSGTLARALRAVKADAISEAGRVDYARLAGSRAYTEYRRLTPRLGSLNLAHIMTRHERLAFWLNLYNALIIDGVIAYGVGHSIRNTRLGAFAFFRRVAYDVGGMRFSCDDIEHGLLRANRGHPLIPGPQFSASDPRRAGIIDPMDTRIHFALNCGSRSCPAIGVYVEDGVDAQLTLATRSALDQDVVLDTEGGELRVPRVFRWFAGDFGDRPGVIAFLLHYLPNDERRAWLEMQGSRARLRYQGFDWSRNVPD